MIILCNKLKIINYTLHSLNNIYLHYHNNQEYHSNSHIEHIFILINGMKYKTNCNKDIDPMIMNYYLN